MRLKSISYVEWQGTPQEWRLETLAFGSRMLIVGKNAAGKSRSVRVTAALARHIIGSTPPSLSGEYKATFDHKGQEYTYELKLRDAEVIHELISIDHEVLLKRGEGGSGTIHAEKISGGPMEFQMPTNILAAVARRDTIQHSFIEPLFDWANSLRFYQFGGLSPAHFAIFGPGGIPVDDRDENATAAIFREGLKLFNRHFIDSILADLAAIDYDIETIELAPPISVRLVGPSGAQPVALSLKERALQGITDQIGMSTGMFRVVALLVHVNFAQFKGSASSVLIDDIGEGLDFDRSVRLIGLLREKAEKYKFQLVMTTNDKFVMNHVPLEEWTVLHRTASVVHVKNPSNSKTAFDEFKFTGLSNFSFFEMNSDQMHFEGIGEEGNA